MVASLFFLFLAVSLGFFVLRLIQAPFPTEEQIIWGIPLGLIAVTLWAFLCSLITQSQRWGTDMALGTVILFLIANVRQKEQRVSLVHDFKAIPKRLTKQERKAWLALVPWFLFALFVSLRQLYFKDGNLYAGWLYTWADWANHLHNSTYLASQDRIPLDHAFFVGEKIQSHYLASAYLSAILQRLGLNVAQSLTWPTVILFVSFTAILYVLARRITGNSKAAVLFVYLFFCVGGMGILYLLKDLAHANFFWQVSATNPRLYTNIPAVPEGANNGIWFMNFIMSEFLPQRAFLAGIPIALYVFYITWITVESLLFHSPPFTKTMKQNLFFAGILFGVLPIIHTHSYIALGLALPVIAVVRYIQAQKDSSAWTTASLRQLLPFLWLFLPALGIGLGLYFLLIYQPHSVSHFSYLIHWWVPNQTQHVNAFTWWFWNAGGLILLGVPLFFWAPAKLRSLLFAGLLLFIVCNAYSFQPWVFDNLKILTYWYLLWSLPIAYFLATRPKKYVIITALLFLLLIGAGLADCFSVTRLGLQDPGILLADAKAVAFAHDVKQATQYDANGIMVLSTTSNEPVSLLSGSHIYMGYTGWLWSWGIDYNSRLAQIQKMYTGSDEGLRLLKQANIHYLVLGPDEQNAFHPNNDLLLARFPIIVNDGDYKLLDVTQKKE